MERLRGHYVAVCKVPIKCTKEQIFSHVGKHIRSGRLFDAVQISGIESSRDLTRWVLWLESQEDANALCALGRADIEVEGENHVVTFERPLVCQVPEQWEKNLQQPFITPRRRPPNPTAYQQQKFLGPLGMQSGFFHNIDPKEQVPIPPTGFEQYPGQDQLYRQHMPGQGNLPPKYDGRLAGHQCEPHEPAYEALQPLQNLHSEGKYEALNQFSRGRENQTSGQKYSHPQMGSNAHMPIGRPPNMPQIPLQPNQPRMSSPMMPHGPGLHHRMPFQTPGQHNIQYSPGYMHHGYDPRSGQLYPMSSPNNMQPYNPDMVTVPGRPSPSNTPGRSESVPRSNLGQECGSQIQRGDILGSNQPEIDDEENTSRLEEHVRLCTIEVTGAPDVICEQERDTIDMYFENNKRSGGGSVINIEFKENAFYVTFESEEVAKQVAEKGDHVIKKKPVSVKLFIPPKPEKPLMQEKLGICTIVVKGPNNVICESEREMIEMYFENERHSSGGPIKSVCVKEGVAYITFKAEEVAKRVVEKANHAIKKCPVAVTLFFPETQQSDEPSTKIVLSNLPSTIHEEYILLFFENKKKLNAGTVLSVDFDEEQGTAIVEFGDPAFNTSSAFTSMDFKKDFEIAAEMITQTAIRDSDEVNDINCSTCSENGQTQEATIYCKSCSVHLCTDCLKDHNKFPMMRTHDVTYSSGQADVGRAQEQGSVEDIPKCVVHHADVEKFCKEHDSVCCRICIALKHRSCKTIISISQAATDILTCPEYKENISSLTKVLTAMTDEKNKERDSLTRLANDREQFLKDVDRYREDLHGRIDKLANGSQQEIKKMYSEVETKHHLNLSTLETVITATNHTLQNMTSQNSVKAFINMKACKNVVHECNALMHEMTIKMEEKKLKCNLNTKIIDKLNNTKTLLLEFPSK